MWDGKSSPLAIIKAKINVILESLCVLEIGQDANQDGDYDFAWLDLLELSKQFYVRISRVSKFRVVQSEWQLIIIISFYSFFQNMAYLSGKINYNRYFETIVKNSNVLVSQLFREWEIKKSF